MNDLVRRLQATVRSVVVGNDSAVERLVAAMVVGGHVLLEGPPGVAKTLLANTLARGLALEFRRAQFTPDMLPSDLTGTMTLRGGELVFRPGPIFTNLLLADEINRTPPKTQAALLEAMQEGHVTVDGESHALPQPFLVVATQNPIEYEGTYPLPEAQLDRFLVQVLVGYPTADDERAMLKLPRSGVGSADLSALQPAATAADIAAARAAVSEVAVAEEIYDYVLAIIRRTRELPSLALGASPRAAVHLLGMARAQAWLSDRSFVTPDDVVALAPDVLRHRLVLRPDAQIERFGANEAVATVLREVPIPR